MQGGIRTGLEPGSERAYRTEPIVLDVGMMMVAVAFMVLGAFGLVVEWLGWSYPLHRLMVPDAALTGLLAGGSFLALLQGWRQMTVAAALPLIAICGYTLWHNFSAGGPQEGVSWITGGPRLLSIAAALLLLWALCCLLGMRHRLGRVMAITSGLLMLGSAVAGVVWLMVNPLNAAMNGFVSSPLLAIVFGLLGGLALLAGARRGGARTVPMGWLSRGAAMTGLVVSSLGWYLLTVNAQAGVQRQASILLDNLEVNTQRLLTQHISLLERLAIHTELTAVDGRNPDWLLSADILVEQLDYLHGLALINADNRVNVVRGSNPDAALALSRWLQEPEMADWLSLPGDDSRARAFDARGTAEIVLAHAVGQQGRRLVAWFDLAALLAEGLEVEVGSLRATIGDESAFLTLRRSGLPLLTGNEPPMPHLERRHVGLPAGTRLVLDVYADSPDLQLRAGLMPAGFALAGIILSYLLALSLGFNRLANYNAKALRLLKRGIESSPNGVSLADARQPDLPLVYVNESFLRITGYSADEVLGRNCRFLQGPQTDPAAVEAVRLALQSRQQVRVLLKNYRRDGSVFWNRLSINPVWDEEGRCSHFIGIQQDVTLEHEQAQRLAYQASHDLLTGLPNRTALLDRLAYDALMCQRRQALLVVMFIDLDDFKSINEALGHEAGNQLLVVVVERLRELLGAGDTLARLVGDEFVMLLPGLEDEKEAPLMADRALSALGQPVEIDGQLVHISASIGLASNRIEVQRPEELLHYADLAMQEAEQRGRNTWQWYRGDAMRDIGERVALRHDLLQALRENQFELYYQPIVEAGSGTQRNVEALLRWHHPTRGLVSPGAFIPLAEHTGQIIDLGRWVLHQACHDLAMLEDAEGEGLSVAVNISPLQFRRDGFVDEVREALEQSGLAPERLELEVTEGVLLSGVEEAVQQLHQLRELGVKVAIDDFGTGFSSLGYLRDLPIQKLKLDRSFVQQVLTSRDAAAIVQGIITLAHQMELVVVAEGIETPEERDALVGYGCDLLQGFLFSHPLPLAQLRALPEALPQDH